MIYHPLARRPTERLRLPERQGPSRRLQLGLDRRLGFFSLLSPIQSYFVEPKPQSASEPVIAAPFTELVDAVDRAGLTPTIDTRYQMADLHAALDHLDRGAFGKIVVEVA